MSDTSRDEDDLLAGEYVLGTLPEAERKAFATRLARESSLQAKVTYWEKKFTGFADEIPRVAPPAVLKAKIESRLFQEQARPQSSVWQNLWFWRGLSLASVLGLATVVAMPYFIKPQTTGTYVAQVSGDAKLITLAAYFDRKAGVIRYNRLEGTPAQGRVFELWAIVEGEKPFSLGVLPDAQTGVITVRPDLLRKMDGGVLAISDEPTGGSPIGQPTGAVLATGKLSTI